MRWFNRSKSEAEMKGGQNTKDFMKAMGTPKGDVALAESNGLSVSHETDAPDCLSPDFTGTFNGTYYVHGCSQDFNENTYLAAVCGSSSRR